VFRKRASPAPAFKQPAPFNPITGRFAPLGTSGVVTRVAMMQVIEADTHVNYVVCRGFDPETKRFFNTVNVAKPYGIRGAFRYVVGNVLPAIKAKTILGDTPGVAETTIGHPVDLDETVGILLDDDGIAVSWILLDTGTGLIPAILYDDIAPGDTDKYAWPCILDESGVIVADTDAEKLTIANTFPGTFRGYGSSHADFDETTAAKVLLQLMPDGLLQIVGGKGLATHIIGSGPSSTVAASATFTLTLTAVAAPHGAQSPSNTGSSTGGTLTVTNWADDLPASATGIVCMSDGSGGYRVVDAPYTCPSS